MWHSLPIEFNVFGTPVSLQAKNPKAKEEWQNLIADAASSEIEGSGWNIDSQRLGVTIFYFPEVEMDGDIDNIVKYIMDALVGVVYVDDNLIDRLVVQRFNPQHDATFNDPSEKLTNAMHEDGPVVYVKIEEIKEEEIIE